MMTTPRCVFRSAAFSLFFVRPMQIWQEKKCRFVGKNSCKFR